MIDARLNLLLWWLNYSRRKTSRSFDDETLDLVSSMMLAASASLSLALFSNGFADEHDAFVLTGRIRRREGESE